MKIGIYQLYFKHEHAQYLNPLFIPYDNTENATPKLREYPLLKKCYDLAIASGLSHWGGVSWSYKTKFGGEVATNNRLFLEHIEKNPGYDVYFFNPFTNHGSIVYNVWEQGQWCHPHLITIMDKVLPAMGMSVELLKLPQTRNNIFWGSMCIGNKVFWDQYFNFAEKYVNCLTTLNPYTQYLHELSPSYVDNTINHFSFIQERLMSTFITTTTLKVLPYHVNENIAEPYVIELNLLKEENQWDEWLTLRTAFVNKIYPGHRFNWAQKWINEINS